MNRLLGLLTVVATLLCVQAGHAAIITFDDRPDTQEHLPVGYGGLNWSNIWTVNGDTVLPGTGFANGSVSGSHVAFNGGGVNASITGSLFTFESAYFSGGFVNTTILMQGYQGSTLLYSDSLAVNTSGPVLFNANYAGIDRLEFSSGGAHFAMDDFKFSPASAVPEPSTLTMFGLGGLSLAFGAIRRRVRQRAESDRASGSRFLAQ